MNHCCLRFSKSASIFVWSFLLNFFYSEIRKRLPKVIKLDGIDLPPPIGFDIGDDASLPSPKASFLCDVNGEQVVRRFLEQYFIIYDSDNRQPLLDAYHEHAMLSLTATYNNSSKLPAYNQYNRNLLRVFDLDARCRLLKIGRLPVVSFFSQLPPTQHDPQSFVVDLTFFSSHLILLTVTGIFKEKQSSTSNKNEQLLRSFQRSLILVPSGGGFWIRNEVLHITNITTLQERKAFKTPVAAPPKIPPNAMPSTSQSVIPPIVLDSAVKLRMIETMSSQTNMNKEWSEKCLEEINWDFQRALFTFTELHKLNKIPPQAFV